MSQTRDPARDQQLPSLTSQSESVFRPLIESLGYSATDTHLRQALLEREQHGTRKYGMSLHSHNGRDALLDAWEESLDLLAYCQQMVMEGENAPLCEAKEMARRLTYKRVVRGDFALRPHIES